jgi:phosphoglycolate phosphatase-like HAD superfamily hydrolase
MVFDLDGTLAESKASLDAEMAMRLGALLEIVKVKETVIAWLAGVPKHKR